MPDVMMVTVSVKLQKISIKAQKDKDKSIKDRAAHWLSENSKNNLNIVRLNGMLKQTAIFCLRCTYILQFKNVLLIETKTPNTIN